MKEKKNTKRIIVKTWSDGSPNHRTNNTPQTPRKSHKWERFRLIRFIRDFTNDRTRDRGITRKRPCERTSEDCPPEGPRKAEKKGRDGDSG